MDALCKANGTFAINLLKMLGEEDHSRNVFFSPLSLSSVLTMVLMGAKGNTAAQMSQVCGLPLLSQACSVPASHPLMDPSEAGRGTGVMERMQT